MDAATILAKINAGYGKAASRVGFPFKVYRPQGQGWAASFASPLSPIGPTNLVETITASFTVQAAGFNFTRPASHKNVLFNGLYDASTTEVGDYLVGTNDTYFIAAQQDLLPPLCARCNAVLSIASDGPIMGVGVQTIYGGTTSENEIPEMTGWPASLIFDARGRATEVGLPGDLPSPFYIILMPAWPRVDIVPGAIITDANRKRYSIAAAEKTALGWRISAQLANT